MSQTDLRGREAAPWHLRVVGAVSLCWYLAGTYTIQMAQLGRLSGLTADELAYYAAKSGALVLMTGIATYGAVAASLLLLLMRRAAVFLFAISLLFVLLSNVIELVAGTSRATVSVEAAVATSVIVLMAVSMLIYSQSMSKRRLLH